MGISTGALITIFLTDTSVGKDVGGSLMGTWAFLSLIQHWRILKVHKSDGELTGVFGSSGNFSVELKKKTGGWKRRNRWLKKATFALCFVCFACFSMMSFSSLPEVRIFAAITLAVSTIVIMLFTNIAIRKDYFL